MYILNPWNLQIIIDNVKIPVLVDAGVVTVSDAAIAMELGCHGVLMNTAIAKAQNPVLMASAMKKAIEAGREAAAGHRPQLHLWRQRTGPLQQVRALAVTQQHELHRHAPARVLAFEAVAEHIRASLRARSTIAASARYVERLAANALIEGLSLGARAAP